MSDYSDRYCKHGTYLGTPYRCSKCREDLENAKKRPPPGRQSREGLLKEIEALTANDKIRAIELERITRQRDDLWVEDNESQAKIERLRAALEKVVRATTPVPDNPLLPWHYAQVCDLAREALQGGNDDNQTRD